MKQLTKTEVESIIDELVVGKLEFDSCDCTCKACEECRGFTHPQKKILIGDVLERMSGFIDPPDNSTFLDHEAFDELLRLWGKCGFTLSIQEIILASGYEECWIPCNGITGTKNEVGGGERKSEQLKDPNARALLNFIGELNLIKITNG